MSTHKGKSIKITPFRALIMDLLHFCQKVPGAAVERPMKLGKLIAARQACSPRPSWTSIFLKAMGIVAAKRPELRQAYMSLPWPRLYEHPINIANFTIERHHQDQDLVFFVQLKSPERRSLPEIDQYIHECKTAPVESVKYFRRAIRMSRTPWPFRRLSMWIGLNLIGKLRAHNFGTFSLTSVAGAGAGVLSMAPLLTTTLHYGLFEDDGTLTMRLTLDHRVIDGVCAARTLVELEEALTTDLLAELVGMSSQPSILRKAA